MTAILMKCGCVSQATCSSAGGMTFDPPVPSCPIHDCLEVADARPSLEGRRAECSYSHRNPKGRQQPGSSPVPSSYDLAFFEYRGHGSRYALETCTCGAPKSLHDKHDGKIPPRAYAVWQKGCAGFIEAGPADFDRFYCGCFGWD